MAENAGAAEGGTLGGAAQRRSVMLGVSAALLAVAIWGGWIVATRFSVVTYLNPIDVGLLRFGTAAAVLAPVWLRTGLLPKGVPLRILLPLLAGSGALFALPLSHGMLFAPAAHTGALVPGTIPLWTALIGLIVFRERFSRMRTLGYILIAAGALLVGGAAALLDTGTGGQWRGHLLYLFAAFVWGVYTHAFIRSGLTALQAVAVSSVWSAVVHGALAAAFGSSLPGLSAGTLAYQVGMQGVLSGIVAFIAFSFAVSRLGPTRAAAFSACVPVIAAVGAWIFIGEPLGVAEILAIACIAMGVALASGLLRARAG